MKALMPFAAMLPIVSMAFTNNPLARRSFSNILDQKSNLKPFPIGSPQSQSVPLFTSTNNDVNDPTYHQDSNRIIIEPSFTKKRASNKSPKNFGVHPAFQKLFQSLKSKFTKRNKKLMTFFATAIVVVSILLAPLDEALAAPSGGRMGGSFGGSNRESTSRSYSSPSYGRSSSYGRGFGRGYGNGYYSSPRTNVIVAPPVGISSYGYGSSAVVVRRGPSVIDVIVFAAFAAIVWSTFLAQDGGSGNMFDRTSTTMSALGPGITVAQISVALNIPDRNDKSSLLTFLDRLSATARTDSRVGVSNLVSQVSLELLRQKRSIFAAGTEYKHFKNGNEADAQRLFNSKAIQERSKFEKENTNKYGGVDYSGKSASDRMLSSRDGFSPQATSAVVTLIISIDGDSTKLPQINNISDLEKALTMMATDVKQDDSLQSAEILWTPDDNNDVLSQRDIIVDYPNLRNV